MNHTNMLSILPTDTCWWIWCQIHDVQAYEKIYSLKKRSFQKPLSVMVESFSDLQEYSNLNEEQIEFLKNYEKPFTVLADSDILENLNIPNMAQYEKVAFRVAHSDIQKKLISEVGPIFLTSANISGHQEYYTLENVKKDFWPSDEIMFLGDDTYIGGNPPSEIFWFEGENCEQVFLRK